MGSFIWGVYAQEPPVMPKNFLSYPARVSFVSDIEQMLSILLHFLNREPMYFACSYIQEVDL